MKREWSDEEQQIGRAWTKFGLATYDLGVNDLWSSREDGISFIKKEDVDSEIDTAWNDLKAAIKALRHCNFIEGVATGLIICGRYDLLPVNEEVEKAATIILARQASKGKEPPPAAQD